MSNPNKGNGAAYRWICAQATAWVSDECLPWPFSRDDKGYGTFGYLGRPYKAHRYMCQLVHGPAPSPKHVASHSCGNGHQGCANPRHLRWATQSENQIERYREHGRGPEHYYGRTGKLSPEQRRQLKDECETSTVKALAERYGVKRGTVDYYRRITRAAQASD